MRRDRGGKGFVIADVRQIRALSSPIRQDILDGVAALGPCSVSELAAAIGKSADGLYYHIRRLLRVGLLREASSGHSERGELRLDVPHKASYLGYRPESRSNRTAVLRVVSSMVRGAERNFRRAFQPGMAVVSGPHRNLWAGRTRGALTRGELAEVNALLNRLNELMRSGRRDRKSLGARSRSLYEMTFVLSPTRTRMGPRE